jgi:predicted pyridoxine 5'-phosphate oxidase superfamily flavin-nucleotide-binding protein
MLKQKKSVINTAQEKSSLPSYSINNLSQLRNIIPEHAKLLDKRIQQTLDFFSREFIDHASIAILGSSHIQIPMRPVLCHKNLFIKNDRQISLRKISLSPDNIQNQNISLYFIAAGIGHCLRINGVINSSSQDEYTINIDAVYFHCARAAARSGLWESHTNNTQPILTSETIISESPYALLKTQNAQGKTEISPRGDENGFIHTIAYNTLFMPERPGNKVAISLRNILENQEIELLFLVPGHFHSLNVKGHAHISRDPSLLQLCDVNGKTPKVGIVIHITDQQFQFDEDLKQSLLWDPTTAVEQHVLTPFHKALSSHMHGTGLLGKATSTVVGAVVKHDMKHLY